MTCIIPTPSRHCSALRGNPHWKVFPSPGKEERGEQLVSSAFQSTAQRSLLITQPRQAKLSCIEMAKTRKKSEATNSSHSARVIVVHSDLVAQTQQISPPKKEPRVSTAAADTLLISLVTGPQVFVFADTSHLSPSLLSSHPSPLETGNCTGSQPRPL